MKSEETFLRVQQELLTDKDLWEKKDVADLVQLCYAMHRTIEILLRQFEKVFLIAGEASGFNTGDLKRSDAIGSVPDMQDADPNEFLRGGRGSSLPDLPVHS